MSGDWKIWGAVVLGLGVMLNAAAPPSSSPPKANAKKSVNPSASSAPHAYTNRLAAEKSPYLRQHMHNPVDWYAWGEEAFAKAKKDDKPIFLSIGYSTCHWCHVMERESFEDPKVAAYLKEHFVSIKVDREERPDVDKIYMTFVQSTTGGGGWPLNVWLTPELKPFFGGTYFAPDDRHGRVSFLEMLQRINEAWTSRRKDVEKDAKQTHDQLSGYLMKEPTNGLALTERVLTNATETLKGEYDGRFGGFGRAPKFPQPSHPRLVLMVGKKTGDAEAVSMVLHTCERMAAGGIHDQLGGGFARYAVDAQWLVPHFEKMLYDNAQLVELYLDAHLVSGEARHAEVVRSTLDYVLRDMTHAEGGFYSAEDADSEGHEGKFYCWTKAELSKLLTVEEFNVATRYFGITEKGNFVDHSHPQPLAGQNVLSIVQDKLPEADRLLLASAKRKMLEVRGKRVRPHLDDKVLSSWNGLMLGAMARAAVVLGEEKYRAAAEKNAAFIRAKLWDAKTGTLYHRWRDGERDAVQLLDAYAFQLAGTISLYEATLDPKHLEFAVALAETLLKKFYDPEQGGFWQSARTPDLIMQVKEEYDGAEPSGNSVATLALLKLGAITERKEFRSAAEKTINLFGERLQSAPYVVTYLCQALSFSLGEPSRVVVAGDVNSTEAKALLRAAHNVFQPHKVVLGTAGPVEPFAKTLTAKDGKAVVYLCTGTACQAPTGEAGKVKEMLSGAGVK